MLLPFFNWHLKFCRSRSLCHTIWHLQNQCVTRNTVGGSWIWLWGGVTLRELHAVNLQLTSFRELGGRCGDHIETELHPNRGWLLLETLDKEDKVAPGLCSSSALQAWQSSSEFRHCWEHGQESDTKKGLSKWWSSCPIFNPPAEPTGAFSMLWKHSCLQNAFPVYVSFIVYIYIYI